MPSNLGYSLPEKTRVLWERRGTSELSGLLVGPSEVVTGKTRDQLCLRPPSHLPAPCHGSCSLPLEASTALTPTARWDSPLA